MRSVDDSTLAEIENVLRSVGYKRLADALVQWPRPFYAPDVATMLRMHAANLRQCRYLATATSLEEIAERLSKPLPVRECLRLAWLAARRGAWR